MNTYLETQEQRLRDTLGLQIPYTAEELAILNGQEEA